MFGHYAKIKRQDINMYFTKVVGHITQLIANCLLSTCYCELWVWSPFCRVL